MLNQGSRALARELCRGYLNLYNSKPELSFILLELVPTGFPHLKQEFYILLPFYVHSFFWQSPLQAFQICFKLISPSFFEAVYVFNLYP